MKKSKYKERREEEGEGRVRNRMVKGTGREGGRGCDYNCVGRPREGDATLP